MAGDCEQGPEAGVYFLLRAAMGRRSSSTNSRALQLLGNSIVFLWVYMV